MTNRRDEKLLSDLSKERYANRAGVSSGPGARIAAAALPANERAVVSILNDTVAHLEIRKPPFQLFRERILPKIDTIQPGEDLSQIRMAVQQCQEFADAAIHYYGDISDQLFAKLKTASPNFS